MNGRSSTHEIYQLMIIGGDRIVHAHGSCSFLKAWALLEHVVPCFLKGRAFQLKDHPRICKPHHDEMINLASPKEFTQSWIPR
jgi:hypothetical protein